MAKIKVLPDLVINQIAAGEVVDRPVSVVRELVDNALDAGASEISIYLGQGGLNLIKVCDNGCGMGAEDALLAFERHATSKIGSLGDLEKIATLGFRGEALASIAAVSRVCLRTRSSADPAGSEITISPDEKPELKACAMAQGTQVEIRGLFFNLPARRKFLKSERAEALRVKEWLQNSTLLHANVRFRLFFDDREVLTLPPQSSWMDRAKQRLKCNCLDVHYGRGSTRIEGLISHPGQAGKDARYFLSFVNGRLVADRMLLRAVKDGFHSTLKGYEYPLGVLALQLPPGEVDVNVHPQKSEVRFRAAQEIYLAVRIAVEQALAEFKSPLSLGQRPLVDADRPSGIPNGTAQTFSFESRSSGEMREARSYTQGTAALDIPQAPVPQAFAFSKLRYLGQALGCYLLCEAEDKFFVVDMHAAHERYNYNLIRNSKCHKKLLSQELLVPLSIDLGDLGLERVLANRDLLESFGFKLEAFGEGTLLVRAAPALLKPAALAHIFKHMAAELPAEIQSDQALQDCIDQIAARLACHGSIRSGQELKREEVYALFEALDSTEFGTACPHGRPVIVEFSRSDVERWFGRDK